MGLGELRIGEVGLPTLPPLPSLPSLPLKDKMSAGLDMIGAGFDKLKDMAGAKRAVLGHAAVGGSVGLCVPERKVALAVTVSKLTGNKVGVKKIVELMLAETGLGTPSGLV